MSFIKKAAFVALMSVAPMASFAAGTGKVADQGGSLNPWTDCGIGAMVFDSTKWAAAISNVIWDLGLTATTSAGVSRQTCEGKVVAAAFFINETYANLEEETAKGGGQHVTAMLNIFGCNAAAQKEIVTGLRSDLASAVSSDAYSAKTSTGKAEDFYFMVQKQIGSQKAGSCQA